MASSRNDTGPAGPALGAYRPVRCWRGWCANLLRDPEEAAQLQEESGIKVPYSDPQFLRSGPAYICFLRGLQRVGMTRWVVAGSRRATVGAVFVYTTIGGHRIISDTGQAYLQCVDPPRAMEVAQPGEFSLAGGDLKNASYYTENPSGLGDMFRLPPVRAGAV